MPTKLFKKKSGGGPLLMGSYGQGKSPIEMDYASPAKQNGKTEQTTQHWYKGKKYTDRVIKKTSEKNPADYKQKIYSTTKHTTPSLGDKPTSVSITRTRAKGTGLEGDDYRKIRTKETKYDIDKGGDITKTVTKTKRKGTASTSTRSTKSRKLGVIGKYFAKRRIKKITKKATKNV